MNEEELYKLLNIPNKPWIELTDEEIQLFEKNNNYIDKLQQESNNLNKGIDELIETYKKEINECGCDTCRVCQTYHKVVQDLKKLKGE